MLDTKLPALEGGKPVRKSFLVFGKPQMGREEIREVVHSMRIGWLGTGPKVARFEEMVNKYVGSRYALALSSCTAGLHLSLIAARVGRGDEVIIPAMTFAATANVVEHVGAKPVLVDVELSTMNIDPNEIEKKITKRTKAIMPVHMAGRPCNMEKILEITRKYNLKVIEDAAHAFGAEYHGNKVGTIGDLTVFSFYATKNLSTGEGGLVTTDVEEYADLIKVYSLHGMSKDAWKRYSDEGFKHYTVQVPGYKYNMMDLQAAIGIHQLEKFDNNQEKRKKIWQIYNENLRDLPLRIPADPEKNTKHAYHLYTILVDTDKLKVNREVIQQALHAENIGIGIHFIALHLHPFYEEKYGYKADDFPNAKYISDRTISLPFSSSLTEKDVKDVTNAVRKVLSYYSTTELKQKNIRLPIAAGN